jgi:iron complex outermembrane receptor protein
MFKKIQILLLLILPMGIMAQVSLQGKVFDKSSGKPLSGASVILNNTFKATSTDASGTFSFNKIKSGKYLIKISFIGYETMEKNLEINENSNENFNLTPKIYMGDEIIVSASRLGKNLSNSKSEISQEEIKVRNTGQDLPYLLSMTPSLVTTSDAGGGVGYTNMRIRGTDLTGINVTLNGVPVNDGESQTVYFVDLPDIASSIDNIQVQRGVGTSTNGATAFGASINIKTDEFSSDPYAELNSSAGSFNTLKSTLKFGTGLIKGKWNFNGRVSSINSDGYVDRAESDLKSAYLSGSYYGEKDILKAVVILGKEKTYQSWYGIPKDSLESNPTYNPAGAIEDADGNHLGYYDNQTDNYNQNYFQLHYARKLNNELNFTASGFYTRGYGYYESYKNDKKFSSFGMQDTIIGNDTVSRSNMITQKWLDNHFYGANFSVIYNSKPLKITSGGGWNQYDGDHYGKVVWAQVARLGDYDKNWYFNNGMKTEANVFVKAEYNFNNKITAYADLQYRYVNYYIEGTHDDLRDLTQDHQFDFINPKLGFTYGINDANKVFLSLAMTNREPNRTAYRDADQGTEMKAENLTDLEIGYLFSHTKFTVSANYFYMKYKDQLVLTGKINNVGSPIMQNVDNSYRTGIEMVTARNVTNYFKWQFNTTLSINKIENHTAYVDNWDSWLDQIEQEYSNTDISFSPNIMANNSLEFIPFNGFRINLLTSYVGKQFIDNTSTDSRSIDAYLVNNIRLNYGIETNLIKRIEFIVSLNNIFNEKYETNAWVYRYSTGGVESEMNGYFPQAGFNFMAGINLRF